MKRASKLGQQKDKKRRQKRTKKGDKKRTKKVDKKNCISCCTFSNKLSHITLQENDNLKCH